MYYMYHQINNFVSKILKIAFVTPITSVLISLIGTIENVSF